VEFTVVELQGDAALLRDPTDDTLYLSIRGASNEVLLKVTIP
jgi:hypothetical protein